MAKENFIFTMQDLRKVKGGKEILKGIWLSFYPGAKIGVIGPNGSGKSTLLRIMAGMDKEFMGEARPDPKARVGFLEQEPVLDPTLDVKGNVELGVKPVKDLLNRFNAVSDAMGLPDADFDKLLAEQAKLQDAIDAAQRLGARPCKLEIAMDALRCPPGDADVSKLSGGEKRRVALCRILLEKPDLLLLDEPTNHLDAESVQWLEVHLKEYPGTIVSVTHDRYFLDNAAQWILELDRGEGVPWKGNYTSWLEQKKRSASRPKRRPDKHRQKFLGERIAVGALEPEGAASEGQSAPPALRRDARRVREREQARRGRRNLHSARAEARRARRRSEGLEEELRRGPAAVRRPPSFKLPPNGIVGVIGPNGAGKTTLFRMLVGQEKPDSGELRIGDGVKMAYVDQSRESLGGDTSVWEEVSNKLDQLDLGGRIIQSRAYLSWFAFKGADQQKRVKDLSGGERNRVQLAKVLKAGGNLLLLDEPTNDLDVETMRSLEEGPRRFRGLRRHHRPRPLVSRSHRDAHSRVRGRQQGHLVRGKLPGLRRGQEEAARARRAAAQAHQVPAAGAHLKPAPRGQPGAAQDVTNAVCVVLATAPNAEKAAELAHVLVNETLAACVNIVPQVRSIYRWEGVVHDEGEALMVVKTTAARFDALKQRILALHPNAVPEVLKLDVTGGHLPYLDWVRYSTR